MKFQIMKLFSQNCLSQRNGKEWVHKKYLTAPNAYNIIRIKDKI